jgi:hypothetical protein
MENNVKITQYYHIECYDSLGNLKWEDGFKNLVTTVGLNHYLNSTLKNSASTNWYAGLKGTGAPNASDTMSSKGWSEITSYSESTRPAYTAGTPSAGSVSNTASKAVFSINNTATVVGAFLVDGNTKGGTTGILLGVGDFSASRSVINGDTINLTVTCTITSA